MPESSGKSLLDIADSRRRPKPGRLNTCSTIRLPPRMSDKIIEIIVIEDTLEFGRT